MPLAMDDLRKTTVSRKDKRRFVVPQLLIVGNGGRTERFSNASIAS
ncbi:MAG: hypothetical protein WCS37_15200 [Chloroflexota bacterium]